MRPVGAVTSLLVFSAGLAFGQVRETVNVNLVEVPVTVVDPAIPFAA